MMPRQLDLLASAPSMPPSPAAAHRDSGRPASFFSAMQHAGYDASHSHHALTVPVRLCENPRSVCNPSPTTCRNPPTLIPRARFNGPDYERGADQARLTGQILRVYEAMRGGDWLTLDELSGAADAPAASVSAQLRHLRKPRFGGFTVEKRSRGDRSHGLWEYRLTP